MICLAYLSSAAQLMNPGELGDVLETSRRNNARADITGLLCHYDGSFMQFLEGEADRVEALYARISRDRRHSQMLRVYTVDIPSRAFGDWSMGVVRADEVSPAQQAFCHSLRQIEVSASAPHRDVLEPFLTSFRSWLR